MLNLKNTLDGYLKNVEVIGNTIQDENKLADIRSVGDKVEGQELYKIDVVSCGKNLNNTTIKRGNIHTDTGLEVSGGNIILCTSDFIQAKPLTKYVVSSNLNISSLLLTCYNKNKDYLGFCNIYNGYFETKENTKYIKFRFKKYNNEEFTDLEVSNINVQFEEGTIATEYEPYQEQKLEILSPVQLEKVGDVADRIICKDGVWGVEKHINTCVLDNNISKSTGGVIESNGFIRIPTLYKALSLPDAYVESGQCITTFGRTLTPNEWNGYTTSGVYIGKTAFGIVIDVATVGGSTEADLVKYLSNNPQMFKYIVDNYEFIPLPHDQQVKLRTFAGQTNIAFLTEIPGQIKAQVPKSLGATVNTHTEQIKDLHNSLDRVKKLEETTVSTVETERNFTTIEETTNGYFEGIKLEGKTLVNLANISSRFVESTSRYYIDHTLCETSKLDLNKPYTFIIYCNYLSNHNTNYNYFEFGAGNKMGYFSSTISTNARVNRIDMPTSGIYTMLLEFTDFKGCEYLACRPCRRSLAPVEGEIANYDISVLLLEGDYTNNPPEYFEGLMSVGQDVEEVSVESMANNLWNDILIADGSDRTTHNKPIKFYRGVEYSITFKGLQNLLGSDSIQIYLMEHKGYPYPSDASSKGVVQQISSWQNNDEYRFVASRTGEFYIQTRGSQGKLDKFSYIQISVGNVNKDVDYQLNKKPLLYYNPTTETWEKPILREWDTIEKHSDGKYYYHKRSGEVVLNGSEAWAGFKATDGVCKAYTFTPLNKAYGFNNLVCDRLPVTATYASDPKYTWGISGTDANNALWVSLNIDATDLNGFKAWLQANPTTVVYQLAQEEVYECTNIDLMTYSGVTNYIINSGAISPKSLLKVHNNISNVVKILQEKVSLLENTFIAGLKSVLSGDMYSLATILYPEDFEQNDNTEQDIMVIPE